MKRLIKEDLPSVMLNNQMVVKAKGKYQYKQGSMFSLLVGQLTVVRN